MNALHAPAHANPCDEPPRILTIILNGKPIDFELDTGASVSLISEADWKAICKPKLSDARATITAYQGHDIPLLGLAKVKAELDGVTAEIDLYVVSTGVALCGRTTIAALRIDCGPYYSPRICKTDNRDALSLDQVLGKYVQVFSEDTGKVTETCSLELKANAKPKFFKHRKIPYAMRDPTERDIERMVPKVNGLRLLLPYRNQAIKYAYAEISKSP